MGAKTKHPCYFIQWENGCLITVKVNITNMNDGKSRVVAKGQKFLMIEIVDQMKSIQKITPPEYYDPSQESYYSGVSHVTYNGKWSRSNPGRTTLYFGDRRENVFYEPEQFRWTAAHEFGHTLGVSDSYNNPKYDNITSIYNGFGEHVRSWDIEKVLYAFKNNAMQYWT